MEKTNALMKSFLMETFRFNDQSNLRMIEKVKTLPDKIECTRHLSHLINSQDKWMARILHEPDALEMSWWEPVYELNDLEREWQRSLARWLDYLEQQSEEVLGQEVYFTGYDGTIWAATPKDIALQLNYHSIHHRAQIQMFVRAQGIEPEFIDYIGTKYRKVSI